MDGFGRFKFTEITLKRLLSAIKIRYEDIPHALFWKYHPLAQTNRNYINCYKNIHKGQRCFIVANGPSLLRTDLSLLDNDVSFGLNRIYLNFNTSSFRPTYFVAINELVLEQFADEIQQLDMPKFLNWNKRAYFRNPDSKLVFLKPKMVINDFFQKDISKPMVFGATVTNVTLQIAYYMGFQQVIIVGMDHNFKDKGTPSKIEVRNSEADENHFNPQYFPKGIKWQLPDLFRSEVDYQIARDAFEADGREVLDATIDGHCNVFKKVEYLSLFSKSG
jgi:hypothetical protein